MLSFMIFKSKLAMKLELNVGKEKFDIIEA